MPSLLLRFLLFPYCFSLMQVRNSEYRNCTPVEDISLILNFVADFSNTLFKNESSVQELILKNNSFCLDTVGIYV